MEKSELKLILEAAIMATGSPLPIGQMEKLFEELPEKERPKRDALKAALKELQEECENRGVELRDLATGFQYRSKQDYAEFLKHLWEERPPRYSRALLETLALVAYKQPITRGAIEEVRGVAVSSQIVKTLLEREWVKVVGHKDVPGRPALYATTKQFLDYFNLKALKELPTLSELNDLSEAEKKLNEQLELEVAAENQPTPVEVNLSDEEDSGEAGDETVSVLEDNSLKDVFESVDAVNQSFSTDVPSDEDSVSENDADNNDTDNLENNNAEQKQSADEQG